MSRSTIFQSCLDISPFLGTRRDRVSYSRTQHSAYNESQTERSRKFCQRGSNSDNGPALTFLLVDEGREDQNPLKAGHHWPDSEMAFRWRADDSPTFVSVLVLQSS